MMMPSVLLRSVARRGSSIVPRRNFSSSPSTTNESEVKQLGVVHVASMVAGYGAAFWYCGDYPKRRDEQRREAWRKRKEQEHGGDSDDIEFKDLRDEIWLRKWFKYYH